MDLKRSIKILSIALAAFVAFSAAAAVSAQANAPRWTVGPVTLPPGAVEPFTAFNTGIATTNIPALGIELTSTNTGDCIMNGTIIGSGIGEPGKVGAMVTCKNVETSNPNCFATSENEKVHGLVATTGLQGTLVWLQEKGDQEAGILFQPVPGGVLAEIEITGPLCPVTGTYNVTGCFIMKLNPVTQDVQQATLLAPGNPIKNYWTNQTPNRVKDECKGKKFGGNQDITVSDYDMTLNSGQLFGVEPG